MTQPQPEQYKDPVITKYIELIKSKTDKYKAFYYGDPIRIPTSNLPALSISRRSTSIKNFTNAEDEHNMELVFNVVTDIRKDISPDNTVTAGTSSLYDLIEGRDPVTLQLKASSLLSIIRHNVDLYQGIQFFTDVEQPTKVDYAMTMGKRQEEHWAIEGSVTIVAKLVQYR